MRATSLLRLYATASRAGVPAWAKAAQKAAPTPSTAAPQPSTPTPLPSTSAPLSSTSAPPSSTTAPPSTDAPDASTDAAAYEAERAQYPHVYLVDDKGHPLRASNGALVPPEAMYAPPRQPLGPRTDRKKGMVDSFRSLPSNQRLIVGLILGIFGASLMVVDRMVPQADEQVATTVSVADAVKAEEEEVHPKKVTLRVF